MAADHATLGTDFGKFVKFSEELADLRDTASGTVTMTAVEAVRDEFITVFNTDATHKFILESIENWINFYRSSINAIIDALWAGPVNLWLSEYVRDQVDSTGQQIQDIVRDWGEAMLNDGEDVEELTVAVVGPTADGDNSGDGTLTVILLEPQEGRPNEVAHNEKYTARVETDSFHGGALPGSETFLVTADLHKGGERVDLKFAEGIDANRIVNGGFEDFTTGIPDSWTEITGGAAITQGLAAGDFIRDLAALEVDGDGATATIELHQLEEDMAGFSTQARIKPLTFYQISAQIRTNKGTGIAAGDSFFIEFQGTGYAPITAERIEIVGPDSAAYTEYKATVQTIGTIPDDWLLAIRYTGTPAAGSEVFVDDLVVQEFTIWADTGLGFAFTRGATADWRAGVQQDYFTLSTTNTEDKKFQRWLIRITDETTADVRTFPGINRMLPSAVAASAAYAEAKAA